MVHPGRTLLTFAVVALLAGARGATAQTPCASDEGYDAGAIEQTCRDYRRILELTGDAPLQSSLLGRGSDSRPFELGAHAVNASPRPLFAAYVLPLRLRAAANSAYPSGGNDGLLWAGRGLSVMAEPGVGVRVGPVRAAFSPAIAWQQNRAFDHPLAARPGSSPFANPFMAGVDLPLRFGPDAYTTTDLGTSYARVDLFGVGAGVSNEPLWWGPGVRNSILLSNNAPGFPHAFVGTSRPLDVRIGNLEAQYVYGQVDESKWFDDDDGNDLRHFTAWALTLEPAFAPGLTVGYAQLAHDSIRGPRPGEDFGDAVPGNRLVGLYGRWAMPAAQFELYGEWARDDRWGETVDLLMEPQHSQAYLFGLQKVLGSRQRVRLHAELANTFEKPAVNATRGVPVFYTHWFEVQGHTQRGQLLGAQIGPQALQQFLAVDLLTAGGFAGLFVERVVHNERFFYDARSRFNGHDLELTAGLRELWSHGGLDLAWEAGISRRWNAYFGENRTNLRGSVSVTWRPGLGFPSSSARDARDGERVVR